MSSTRRILADLDAYSRGYLRNRAAFIDAISSPMIVILMLGVILTMPSFAGRSSVSMTTFAPGLLSLVPLIAPMQSMTATASSYKKEKLFKELSITPITKTEWLISKVVWFIILTLLGFVPSVVVLVVAFGANVPLTPLIIPFLALASMFFTSLGMLVGTVAKSPETATMVSYIVLFPMMFFSGAFFPVALMSTSLQDIAHLLPQFYVVDGLNAVMLNSDYGRAIADLAIVAVLTPIVSVLAARLCKWRED
jgi:ABC-2 type transport system permease protein